MFLRKALEKLKAGLDKTRNSLRRVKDVLFGRKIDQHLLEDLEEILLAADIGVPTTTVLLDALREKVKTGKLAEGVQLFDIPKS